MPDFKFKAFPHQLKFLHADTRFVVNSGGVGAGKTFTVALKAFLKMAKNPGILGLIGAKTMRLVRETTMREFFNLCPPELIKNFNRSTSTVKLFNDSELIFTPLDDYTKFKSLNLGFVGIEEMIDNDEEVFKVLRERLRQTTVPESEHQLFGATNPGSFENWVYKNFIDEDSKTKIKDSTVIFSSSHDNKTLPAAYLADLDTLKATNPEYYARMILGQWGQLEGLVYQVPLDLRLSPDEVPHTFQRVIAGLDFGYNHAMACSIAGQIEDRFYIFDELYRYQMRLADLIDWLSQKCNELDIECIYCDSARPDLIAELQDVGLPAVPASKGPGSVYAGIMHVKNLFGSGLLFVSQECKNHLREFDSYVWDKNNKVKEAPLKVNDHLCDAVRYMLHTDGKEKYEFDILAL